MRDEVTVVVPHHNVLVPIACLCHGWPQVKLQKVTLFLRRVDARFPALGRHRLVLDGHPPNRKTLGLIRLDKLDEILGPCAKEFRKQRASAQHVLIRLHERRRTPWTRVKHQVLSNHLSRTLNHGDALDGVWRDGKRGQ